MVKIFYYCFIMIVLCEVNWGYINLDIDYDIEYVVRFFLFEWNINLYVYEKGFWIGWMIVLEFLFELI